MATPGWRWSGRLGVGLAAALVLGAAVVQQPSESVERAEQTVGVGEESALTPILSQREGVLEMRITVATPELIAIPTAPAPTPAPTHTAVRFVPRPTQPPTTPTATRVAVVVPRQPSLPIKGMGYSPLYLTADQPEEARATRVRRDMRLMAEAGVTLVHGWEQDVFDETLLAAADASGLAVLQPFDLKPAYNYANPDARNQLTNAVLAWIERYRNSRAIAMWAIGNEVTLEMSDAERRTFADYYVELFERVRKADPSRPVILREAEDVFAPYLADAFAQRGFGQAVGQALKAPDGFVYGVNFYTDRVGPALKEWVDNTGLDAPLFVSEYAPAGAGFAARPGRFVKMYGEILEAGPRVLGSAPYTWTTSGPEAVDAYFGLVDAEGQPVDDTVAELARLYGVEPPAWTKANVTWAQTASAAELPKLIDAAVAAAGRLGDDDSDEVSSSVAAHAREAANGASESGAERYRTVSRLAALARELAAIHQGNDRLFPGMRESLPLLDGMARWSAIEPSAPDTARSFLATVLRKDLASLGS